MKNSHKIVATLTLTALLVSSTSCSLDLKNHLKYGVKNPNYYSFENFDDQLSNNFEVSFNRILNNSNFVPQGITFDNDSIFVSLYDYDKEFNSIIMTLDFQGHFKNLCTIKNDAHVGGISYDGNNDLLWITSKNGLIDAYKVDDIKTKDEAKPYYQDLNVGKGLNNYMNPFNQSVSFITIKGKDMFVGNFSLLEEGLIKRYDISKLEDDSIRLTFKNSFLVPNKVQGVSFYKKDGQEYMLLSRSFSNKDSSMIQIYKYFPEIVDYTKESSTSYEFPSMIEETTIINDHLYSLYESNANPYNKEHKKNKTLRISKMESLF